MAGQAEGDTPHALTLRQRANDYSGAGPPGAGGVPVGRDRQGKVGTVGSGGAAPHRAAGLFRQALLLVTTFLRTPCQVCLVSAECSMASKHLEVHGQRRGKGHARPHARGDGSVVGPRVGRADSPADRLACRADGTSGAARRGQMWPDAAGAGRRRYRASMRSAAPAGRPTCDSISVWQCTHSRVVGRASRRGTGMSSPQASHTP